MPKYRVTTDKGVYNISLDQPVESQEELMALVQDAIGRAPEEKGESKRTPSRPEGFAATFGSEWSGGASDIAKGIKRAMNPDFGGFLGVGQAGMGALRMAGAPGTATGRWAGEGAQDILSAYGAGPNVSAAGATIADLGMQFAGFPALVRSGVRAVGRRLSPSAITETIQAAANKFGIPVTASELTQSRGLAQLEGIPTRFPLGVEPIAKFGRRQVTATKEAIKDVGGKISPEELTPIQAGELFKETMEKSQKAVRSQADEMYSAVKEAIPENEIFETPSLLKASQDIAQEAKLSKGVIVSKGERTAGKIKAALEQNESATVTIGGVKTPTSELTGPLGDLIKKHGMDNPDRLMTYEGMDFLRKDLRQALRDARKAQNDIEARRLSTLIDGLSEDMRGAAKKFPGAATLHEDADKFYKAEVAPFFTKGKLPRKLSDTDASQIVKSWIWGNRDHPENINLVKAALKKPEEYRKITRAWWEDLSAKSIDPRTREFSMAKFISDYNRFSPGARVALLGPAMRDADELVGLMGKITTAQYAGMNPSGTAMGFGGVSQLATASWMVSEALAGNLLGAVKGGVALLAPKGLAHVVTSPTGIKLLSRQMQLPPGSPEAMQTATRIIAIANSALSQSAIADILRTESISLEDKIAAGQGVNP